MVDKLLGLVVGGEDLALGVELEAWVRLDALCLAQIFLLGAVHGRIPVVLSDCCLRRLVGNKTMVCVRSRQ